MSRKANKSVGARYECIYKNFLREIRQFYSNKFDAFIKTKPTIRKNNLQMKSILFPYNMLQFTSEVFDHSLVQSMFGCNGKDNKSKSQNIK